MPHSPVPHTPYPIPPYPAIFNRSITGVIIGENPQTAHAISVGGLILCLVRMFAEERLWGPLDTLAGIFSIV